MDFHGPNSLCNIEGVDLQREVFMLVIGTRPVARPKSQRVQNHLKWIQGRALGSKDGELLYPKYIGCKAKRQRVQRDGGEIDGAIPPNAPAWLRAWVQHNFRRTLLVPSRVENISSLGAAVQHNFRRTLLVPSREENISSLGAAVQHNFRRTLLLPFS